MSVITRRTVLAALAASPLLLQPAWAQNTTLKISHQFPGGTITEGDFRDRLTRMFAAEVEKRSKGSLKFEIYPGSSLMKTNAQFSAMRKGALDMSLVPLSYAGGEVPEVNIGLMPGLVTSYEQAYGWKNAEVGKELSRILNEKGIVLISWIWQAGGVASRTKPVIDPDDAKGMKIRGGSREMDLILKAAGAAVVSLPSNEIYAAMQTGAMEAALTSSTSLISFRLEEVSKGADHRPRRRLLVHVRAADDVQGRLRPLEQGPAGHHHGGRRRDGSLRAELRQGRRPGRGRRLRQSQGQGGGPESGRAEEMAGHRPRHRMEGLRRTQ